MVPHSPEPTRVLAVVGGVVRDVESLEPLPANALAPCHYDSQTAFGEREVRPEMLAMLRLTAGQLERRQAELLEIGTPP